MTDKDMAIAMIITGAIITDNTAYSFSADTEKCENFPASNLCNSDHQRKGREKNSVSKFRRNGERWKSSHALNQTRWTNNTKFLNLTSLIGK